MITSLPPLDGWPQYAEAVAVRDRLAADLRQAQRDLDALPERATAAVKADEDEHAAALIAGESVPKTRKATAKHQQEAETLKHHAAALASALEQQERAVLALLSDQRGTAQQAAQDQVEAAREAYRASLDGLADAREAYWSARRAQAWLEDSQGRRYKPGAAPGLTIPGAVTLNSEPLQVGPVLAALAAETGDGPRLVPGPWRGTVLQEGEQVRMVRRHRPDYLADPTGRTSTTYAIPADQVEADLAATREAQTAQEQRDWEQTRQVMRAQAATAGPAGPVVTGDPLADLRDGADA